MKLKNHQMFQSVLGFLFVFFFIVVFLIQMDFCKAFCTSENTCGKCQVNFCQGGISDTKTHSV